MIEREWADLPGYPGVQVSRCGQVRVMCCHRKCLGVDGVGRYHLRKQSLASNGYYCVHIKPKVKMLVHRALLIAFTGGDRPGMYACHNNGIRTDNRLENLRWGTPTDNAQDAVRHGSFARRVRKITRSVALSIRTHKGWLSSEHLAEVFGLHPQHVNAIFRGARWGSL